MSSSSQQKASYGTSSGSKSLKRRLPHILLIVTDQFRYDSFGPTITPNLYGLATAATSSASVSTLFSNAYASTPTCTPSRAALLTGKSPWHHGMLGYAPAVDCERYATTLPSVLADLLGYETVVVGKNHFGTKPFHNHKEKINNKKDDESGIQKHKQTQRRRFIDHGYHDMKLYDGNNNSIPDDYDMYFDRMLPGVDPLSTCHLGWNDWEACPYGFDEYLHPTAWTTRQAVKAIEKRLSNNSKSNTNHNSDPPLFLKVSYHRPHSPYDPPKRLWDKHASNSQTNPQQYSRNIGKYPSSWDKEYLYSANHTASMPHDAWHGDPGEAMALRSRAAYLASVEFVDEGIGLVLEALRRSGYDEDTFVVWTSDHGDMNGDHNLWRKGYPWEAASHVSMVMKLPSSIAATTAGRGAPKTIHNQTQRAATVSDAIVELRDVAPTIYDLVGIWKNVTELDPMVNGRSLLPILRGTSSSVRSHLDLEHSTVYDNRIHWNAIVGVLPPTLGISKNDTVAATDTRDTNSSSSRLLKSKSNSNCALYKYIYFAGTGTEQLFCLSEDPRELHNLAPKSEHQSVLSFWRDSMARGFVEEGRGPHWVTEQDDLVIRTRGTTYGPNYPCGGVGTETADSISTEVTASIE